MVYSYRSAMARMAVLCGLSAVQLVDSSWPEEFVQRYEAHGLALLHTNEADWAQRTNEYGLRRPTHACQIFVYRAFDLWSQMGPMYRATVSVTQFMIPDEILWRIAVYWPDLGNHWHETSWRLHPVDDSRSASCLPDLIQPTYVLVMPGLLIVTEGLYVDCLVCSNLCAGESRHYWLVEINEGKVQQIYDSLQGVQPLTQEIYRMLQVTGILLKSTSSNKPVLKCPQLEHKAGIIEAVSRRAPTIKVASRSRTCKTRHELVKSMNRLSITPTKAYGVSKKLGKKMKGVNVGLKQVDTHERLLLPRSSTAKKPQAFGPARKRAKKKTHPKRTQKAGTPGNRLHKGIGEFLSQPKLHELGQPIVARDEVDDTVESVSDDAGDGDSRQSLAAKEKPLQQEALTNLDNASDPISDFVTQQNDGDNHPQREKKRTFEQADLEGVGPVTVDTEDNMRRKQGPPKVSDVSPEGQQCPTDTGQEFHHAARYQYEETKAASGENASREESGINEAAYAGNERSKQEGPPTLHTWDSLL